MMQLLAHNCNLSTFYFHRPWLFVIDFIRPHFNKDKYTIFFYYYYSVEFIDNKLCTYLPTWLNIKIKRLSRPIFSRVQVTVIHYFTDSWLGDRSKTFFNIILSHIIFITALYFFIWHIIFFYYYSHLYNCSA